MHLASISSQEENDRLEKHIRDYGKAFSLLINDPIGFFFQSFEIIYLPYTKQKTFRSVF